MKWFKHDSDASLDAKLKRVRQKYGMEGYGLYWYCLELIAQNVEKHNLTFELEHDAELIGIDTNIHQERVQEMMADFIKWKLFENTDGVITCLKMASRTDEYTQQLIRSDKKLPIPSLESPENVPGKVRGIRREEKRREEKKDAFRLPEWIDVNAWTEWEKYRIEKKKPLTDLAREKCAAVLERNKGEQKKIIDNSIMNGWTGLFGPKVLEKPSRDQFKGAI